MFELFDHTADLGLRVEAPTLEQLLAEAGAGLLQMLVANPREVRPLHEVPVAVDRGPRADDLLFDWLSELLYLYETDQWLLAAFELSLTPDALTATARGERAGPHHQLDHEVKAITYHELEVRQTAGRWHATVIVDI